MLRLETRLINELFNSSQVSWTSFSQHLLHVGSVSTALGKEKIQKVKKVILKVVRLPWLRTNTLIGAEHEKYLKKVWAQESFSADGLRNQITRELGWPADQYFQYMYANGRHLRVAKLSDVENSASWDCKTLRALMGNGSLYLCKVHDIDKGHLQGKKENRE